jgi:hypothetical protein
MRALASVIRPSSLAVLGRHWLTIILGIAFLFSTFLTIEQNRIITAQRALIQSLYFDSASLIALKMKLAREQRK